MIHHLLISGRAMGKTTRLVSEMLEDDTDESIYVGATLQDAERAYNMACDMLRHRRGALSAREMRNLRQRFLTWEQAADPWFGSATKRRTVVIDGAEHILAAIFKADIRTVTMNHPASVETFRPITTEGNPE